MFENPLPLSLTTIGMQYTKIAVYLAIPSLFVSALMPEMSPALQEEAVGALLEHSAPRTFHFLASWVLFALPALLLLSRRFDPDSQAYRWLAIYPACRTFELGSIGSGVFLGLGVGAAIFWCNVGWALWGIGLAAVIFAYLVGFVKIYGTLINPPRRFAERKSSLRALVLVAALGLMVGPYVRLLFNA
ncbi:hypothetical protein [Alkalilimnicola sp. S0819]|uniref:hypothetical protein n=1 Tax=Alkalilimnicola sp. S0819 TaxID=2613922 RepID=UPI00126297CC|nr:hypothetical protein [Alkalilimnicola sp. S0819]KAB7619433.1 hypothetical protein F3N43_13800 [Alkalilimnicola sp. S0819]MPQ17711.1 hypothetical protein [Alkalilimnicola sp. S0819]